MILVFLLAALCSAQFATHTVYEPKPDWPGECETPERSYLLSRHGIREPSKKIIAQAQQLQEHVGGSSLPWLAKWKNPFSDADDLVSRGLEELRAAGRRLARRMGLGARLTGREAESIYDARSTRVRRAARSGVAFCEGLENNRRSAPYVWMEGEPRDVLLRPFKTCLPYVKSLENPLLLQQHVAFATSHFPAIAAKLRNATGLSSVTTQQVGLFWELCAYETALFRVTDRFCSLFSDHENELLSYWSDLSFYYRRGPGNNLTHLLPVAMADEIDSFFFGSAPRPRALLRFGHAETVMPMLVFLGLFQDSQPLTASTPESVWRLRKWNTSRICPFQANVGIFRARCAGTDSIVVQVNERTEARMSLASFKQLLARGRANRTCAAPRTTLAGWFGC
jgi:hypothetical protein